MKAYIATHLAAMSKFLGLKERLSSEHIDFVADELIENYGQWMTVADINLVIKRIKCGYYGELYNDLNAQKVLGIFSKYDIERDDAVARHRSSEMKKSSVMADKSWFTVKDGKYVMKTDYFVAQVRNLIMEKELNGIGADYRRRMVAALDNLIISAFAMKEFEKHVLPEDVKDVPTGKVNVADLRKFVYKKIKTEYYRDHGNKEEQGAGEAAQGTGETGEGDK